VRSESPRVQSAARVVGISRPRRVARAARTVPVRVVMVLNVYEEFRGWLFRRAQRKRGGV
jgi:hypothetical protein